jgi:hypothetical protein
MARPFNRCEADTKLQVRIGHGRLRETSEELGSVFARLRALKNRGIFLSGFWYLEWHGQRIANALHSHQTSLVFVWFSSI